MKKLHSTSEAGQAFLELTVMLIGITAMILGTIVLFGVENTSNTLLLDSRFEAHKAVLSNRHPVFEPEVDTWQEVTLELDKNRISPHGGSSNDTNHATLFSERGRTYILSSNKAMLGKNLHIPFALTASMQQDRGLNTIAAAGIGLNAPQYSKSHNADPPTEFERYNNYRTLDTFKSGFRHDFYNQTSDQNAFFAAQLVKGESSSGGSIYTINAAHQRGPLNSSSRASSIMYESFYKIFGIQIKPSTLKDNPGNQVYMPITDEIHTLPRL